MAVGRLKQIWRAPNGGVPVVFREGLETAPPIFVRLS